jgi:hypothetical protein
MFGLKAISGHGISYTTAWLDRCMKTVKNISQDSLYPSRYLSLSSPYIIIPVYLYTKNIIYCRKIYKKGFKYAKNCSISNKWTSRFLQGLSTNQYWGASSHPDWGGYEGSGDHNTSYVLLAISALYTNLH